ncbi:MAG: bifunctional demethylmenaquinone methyltransferase/2-methoxy-6-polyprenyl-1,4-benzoquinol methylase UbiE [Phycisphaerae bacterium]|nr:bifunctional demethylmenaquinone methyltransferase/2-methoxy-6-polyprenyl-1,4-benzoquinol methylase UbiE [Phycisphaerae bacterium]
MATDPPDSSATTNTASKVRDIFGRIAPRYDLANHVLSLGIDFHWRKKAVRLMQPLAGRRVLDMCCGTGDLTLAFTRAGANVVGCDFSPDMVELAALKETRLRARGKLPDTPITWRIDDCTATGFDAQSFDIVSCAFGVRNMADHSAGVAEMHRLLRPGGTVCILEFSLPTNPIVRAAYLTYFRWIMPLVGGLITGRTAAYRYLRDSVRKWHENVDLAAELRSAGFENIQAAPLTLGITTLYRATRPI